MATARPLAPPAELTARVEMLCSEAVRAFNKRDLDKLVSLYAHDAVVMAPNRPLAHGPKAIRELYREAFEMGFSNFKTEILKTVVSNETIITHGTYTLDFKDPSNKVMTDRGKFVGVYQLLKNDDCKLIFDIWNSDLPPVPMPTK